MNKDTKNTILAAVIIFAIILYYLVYNFYVSHPYLSVLIIALIFVLIILLIKYSYQHEEFREKGIGYINGFIKYLNNFFKTSRANKTRIPISTEKQQQLFERAENRCQYCGLGNVKLNIHHIDGNPSNNNSNNLIVLCPNHHSIANSLNVNVLKNDSKKPYRIKITTQKIN